MKRLIYIVISLISACAYAAEYKGRVVDINGSPIPYATVYLEANPIVGTATNNQGDFCIATDLPATNILVVSFIGYEKQLLPLSALPKDILLKEQPIALQETVVSAKASKQKNKRKEMAQLLYKVFNRMQYDFPDSPTGYRIVSDVKMNSERTPWGMEQMVASVVNIPNEGSDGRDSVQFAGEHCKRYFLQAIRNRADSILVGSSLDKNLRKMANEVDSGVVVHQALWAVGNIKYDFEQTMNDIKHWSVSRENEKETVLTHVEKKNYLGIFKYEYTRHYIVDSDTYRVLRFSETLSMAVNVPFGYKFKKADLELLNLLNMSEEQIEKFRLKKADATINLNTIYTTQADKIYLQEKNLSAKANLLGTKDMVIPVDVIATQRAIRITANAKPMAQSALTSRVKREIVPIY